MNRRPELSIVAPDASPEEAAAVVAALERYMRETAPTPGQGGAESRRDAWQDAALREGVIRSPEQLPPWM
jgi:hypothetical protein